MAALMGGVHAIGRRLGVDDRPWWRRALLTYHYGNTVDFDANVEGERRIETARRDGAVASVDGRRRRAYARDQFSRLEGLALEPELFESVRARAVAVLDDPAASPCLWRDLDRRAQRTDVPWDEIPHDVRRFTTDVAAAVPDAADLLSEEIVAAIRSSVASNFTLENIYLTRNFHLDADVRARCELLSERWHFDDQITDGFSLFVCLSHVAAADGPFHTLNRRDSMKLLRRGYSKEARVESATGGLTREEIEAMPSFTRLTGPPGTMLLCHTSFCLHRAGVPEAGHVRDMMIFTFRPSARMDLAFPRPAG